MGNSCNGTRANSIVPSLMATPLTVACLAAARDAANAATRLEDWWEGGAAPMLVIQGSDDIVAPPGNGHLLRQALGARGALVDLPGVGHAMLPERPEAIAALVADWLAGRAATGG